MKTPFPVISFLVSLLIFFGCSEPEKKKETATPTKQEKSVSTKEIDRKEDIQTEVEQEEKEKETPDCIFDLSTQNDDFLKGIGELEGYNWNPDTKTAFVRLSKTETLDIHRGGCDEFTLEATFTVPKDTTLETHEKYIFEKILWISELLYHPSDYKVIEEAIQNGKTSFNEIDTDKVHINLMDQKVYNNYVIFYDRHDPKYNTFSISYFIN